MKVLLIIRERQTKRMYCDKGVLWLREEEKRVFLKAERER